MEGFGRIAVAIALADRPEAECFRSWTAMVMSGLRTGDKVLMPESRMPTHWARNRLARAFLLEGEHDSLFFVDGDMQWEVDALERMREDERTFDYDIVQAFCTHRTGSPKPVILRNVNPQPEEPFSLRGEHFDIFYDWEDGDVVPVDACGMAFTLIRRWVVEQMTDPSYGPEFTHYFQYKANQSEDVFFCQWARELGAKMCVNTAIKVKHCGVHPWGWSEFLNWREATK